MDDDFEGFDGDEGIQEDANVMEEEFADVGDTSDRMRLQAATHYFIGKICDNEGTKRKIRLKKLMHEGLKFLLSYNSSVPSVTPFCYVACVAIFLPLFSTILIII